MRIRPGTQKADALLAIAESTDRLTQRQVAERIGSHYASSPLADLWNNGFVDRNGIGGPHNPYQYSLTPKGVRAADKLGHNVSVIEQFECGLESDDAEMKDHHIKRALSTFGVTEYQLD